MSQNLDIVIRMVAEGRGGEASIEQIRALTAEIRKLESEISKVEKAGGSVAANTDARLDQLKGALSGIGPVNIAEKAAQELGVELPKRLQAHLATVIGRQFGLTGIGSAFLGGSVGAGLGVAGGVALLDAMRENEDYRASLEKVAVAQQHAAETTELHRVIVGKLTTQQNEFNRSLRETAEHYRSNAQLLADFNTRRAEHKKLADESGNAQLALELAKINDELQRGVITESQAAEKRAAAHEAELKRKRDAEEQFQRDRIKGEMDAASAAGEENKGLTGRLGGLTGRIVSEQEAINAARASGQIDTKFAEQERDKLLDLAAAIKAMIAGTETAGQKFTALKAGVTPSMQSLPEDLAKVQKRITDWNARIAGLAAEQSDKEQALKDLLNERAEIQRKIKANEDLIDKSTHDAAMQAEQLKKDITARAALEKTEREARELELSTGARGRAAGALEKFFTDKSRGSNRAATPEEAEALRRFPNAHFDESGRFILDASGGGAGPVTQQRNALRTGVDQYGAQLNELRAQLDAALRNHNESAARALQENIKSIEMLSRQSQQNLERFERLNARLLALEKRP